MDIFLAARPTVCLLAETLAGPLTSALADALNDICSLQTRQPDVLAPDALAEGALPDLILIDGDLPGDQSDRLCLALKHHPSTQRVPVIWLSRRSSTQDQIRGFACGAADYIASTVPPELLRARVQAQLVRHGGSDVLSDINQLLEQTVLRSTQELATIQHVTLAALTALAETRDNETGNHIQRTQHYVRALALQLQNHPRFASFLTANTIEMLFRSAPLHDIGKVGIPDRILLKPGRFEPEEMAIMKTHTPLGRDVIEQAERLIGAKVGFLTIAKEIAYSHQEKWDGSGYPEGLAGEAIPVSARLMALADVYDAIISRRVYKEGMSHASAVHIITQGRGQHFDPDIVDAFLAILDEFQDIAARYADSDADLQKKQDYLEIATVNQRANT
jgi:putative two-component system response regulator